MATCECGVSLPAKDAPKHRGWRYDYDQSRPATGVWRAAKYGITVSAGTEQQLLQIIDYREVRS